MGAAVEIADLERMARQRVPKMFFEYADSGSWTEQTYRANTQDLRSIKLRQRVLKDISTRRLDAKVLGESRRLPVALAPVGMTGMQYPDGEICAAQAAEEFGVPYTLSTMSVCSIEAVAAETKQPFWFQLYVMKDRDFIRGLIERAQEARCSALVLTVDLQVLGQRHKDVRNGLSVPPRVVPKHIWQVATRPRWCWRMFSSRNRSFGNVVGHAKGVSDVSSLATWAAEQFDPSLEWADVEWIKKKWGGRLILKGILDAEDARLAVQSGADAIVVSNHGGRQLDGAPSTISALPKIVDAVGADIEVHMDGGIRSGQDAFKALCLGAKAVHLGRAYIYGLAAMGKSGVKLSLEIIEKELDLTMALSGTRSIEELGCSNIWRAPKHNGERLV